MNGDEYVAMREACVLHFVPGLNVVLARSKEQGPGNDDVDKEGRA